MTRIAVRVEQVWRASHVLAGVVVGVVVVATLAVCLAITLVAWVSAHEVAGGVGVAAVALTALAFLRHWAPTRPVRLCER